MNYFVAILSLVQRTVAVSSRCYPAGPLVPEPVNLSSTPAFTDAIKNLTNVFDHTASREINVSWPVENVSFSVGVVSVDQDDAAVPLWEYHHHAHNNIKGTATLNRDSQWLIGSVSKLFTVYLMLVSGINIEKSIVEFLPELRSTCTPWEDVTLRRGIPVDYGFSEYYFLKDVFVGLGLPPLDDSDYPPCGVAGLNGACNAQEILDGISQSYPITAVMERPAYSNAAFNIIALALERFTGKNYTDLLRDYVGVQMGMGDTYPSPGDDDRGIVPPGESSWGADYGFNTPAGGLVSTLSDLSRFSHGLLTNSLALTPAQTRAWLKPAAFAEGHTAVGMPWGITTLSNLTPDHPHPVTLYGKSGGAQLYRSQVTIVPEYGIAIVVLTAGSMRALPSILDAVIGAVLPAVDAVARAQAREHYARTFETADRQDESAHPNYRVVIEQDEDSLILGPVTATVEGGRSKPLNDALEKIWTTILGEYTGNAIGPTIRLFPTAIETERLLPGKPTPVRGEVWRLWPDLQASIPTGGTGLPHAGLVSGQECMTWSVGDWVHYGGEPLDRVVFFRDEDGQVLGMEMPFLRTGVLYVGEEEEDVKRRRDELNVRV